MTLSNPDPRRIIGNVPGRVCINPVDLGLPYPYGGEDLGEIADCYITNMRPRSIIRDEVTGFDTVEIVSHGESCALFMSLRDHNVAAYQTFLGATLSAKTGAPIISSEKGFRAGFRDTDQAIPFLFVPYDLTNDPVVYIPAGIPLIEETTRITAMLGGPGDMWMVPAVVEALGTDGIIWECVVFDDLTL